jgi:phenylacetate-coenzyme A ligase PaaK-like adenylate-forming protein
MTLDNKIFEIDSSEEFEEMALAVFRHQYKHTKIYRTYCDYLNISEEKITSIETIPFLPIQFYKSQQIISEGLSPEALFTSSGTTGNTTSKHYIADISLYEKSFLNGFQKFYGKPDSYAILALLPSYLERENSSLVFMVDRLIKDSGHIDSGFYLDELSTLTEKLNELEAAGQKSLLLGVSYALLDLIEAQTFNLEHTIVMETGGMKGRRKEMVKEALHARLKDGFGVDKIHSEYGMTELLSQAYSHGEGLFRCPPWMKILTRDPNDSLTLINGKTGGINIIDLANIHSCSFIASEDLGKVHPDGSFEILGRFDTSDIRGCNLMVL